jgi:hypothetical protein
VTSGGGSDPEIVLGNRAALLPKTLLHTSIYSRYLEITEQDGSTGGKPLNFGGVLRRASRPRGSEQQLSDCNDRKEDFRRKFESRHNALVTFQQSDDDVGVNRYLPLAGIHALAFFFDRLGHFSGGCFVKRSREPR